MNRIRMKIVLLCRRLITRLQPPGWGDTAIVGSWGRKTITHRTGSLAVVGRSFWLSGRDGGLALPLDEPFDLQLTTDWGKVLISNHPAEGA